MRLRARRARLDRLEARLPKPGPAVKDGGLFDGHVESLSDHELEALDLRSLSDDQLEAFLAEVERRLELVTREEQAQDAAKPA